MGYFMKSVSNSRQIIAGLAFGFFVVTGTYNAIVINSESAISGDSIRFIKRLDEAYGVVVSKREVATSMHWQKLSVKQAAIFKSKYQNNDQLYQQSSSADQAPGEVAAEAAVQEELNLSLTGVINPKKWQQGLNATQFNGSLTTNQGVIESLSVSLPNDEGLSVSFSEMTGNVFEYDFNGELYSGMMYQENQNSYVVTLTNGPLEGTRLTFTGESLVENVAQQEEAQQTLAENSDSDAGIQQEQEIAQPDPAAIENSEMNDAYAQEQGQIDQAQGFNFEQTQASM